MPANVVETSHSANSVLRPVPIEAVKLDDQFWEPRRKINREVTIPSQHQHCEETHRIDNFRVASGRKQGEFVGIYFNDSDVYKWVEAACWDADPRNVQLTDDVIDEIAAAQQPNGYLNTYFMFDRAKDRWSNLKDKHEMYCAGHLIQAAIAHHRVTKSRKFLDVAKRLADHICTTFGPGRREGACGHPEIEMAMVELFRTTGEKRYLDQAIYLLDARGRGLIGGGEYHQDHKPVREVDRVTGHAVRQLYLACGMTDICLENDDAPMRAVLDRLWSNFTEKQMYITGAAGSRHEGEAFGRDYELPNERAYAETCAGIASVMWNWRMLLLTSECRYADVMERALYNNVLAGISLDGQSYFYVNPLADTGSHRRQPWFGCACCPPNIARLLSQLPAYFYSTRGDDEIFVHLFAQGTATIGATRIEQITNYPWDGKVTIRVQGGQPRTLRIRIPDWCTDATVDGQSAPAGSYATSKKQEIEVNLPMDVRRNYSHPHVAENLGRVAFSRGPLIYCAETIDNPGVDLRDVVVGTDSPIAFKNDRVVVGSMNLVPYYMWANREPGRMAVWLREKV